MRRARCALLAWRKDDDAMQVGSPAELLAPVQSIAAAPPGPAPLISLYWVWLKRLKIRLLTANRRRKIDDVDRFPVSQSHCACDAVLQFPNVSRPIVIQEALHGRGRHLEVRALRIAL